MFTYIFNCVLNGWVEALLIYSPPDQLE